jgi:SAM-dependent methyltransferase
MTKPFSRYDRIGTVYARHRCADPRIARQIHAALGDARRVLDVGAGTGSYEPSDREVFAIEPSETMIAQRPAGSAPVVRGVAEHLPFLTQSFNASMAVLTLHHWSDQALGLAELRRVAPRRVVLCFDVARLHTYWLVREYLPEIATLDYGSIMSPEEVADAVDASRIESVGVPWDCTDGFSVPIGGDPSPIWTDPFEPASRESLRSIRKSSLVASAVFAVTFRPGHGRAGTRICCTSRSSTSVTGSWCRAEQSGIVEPTD